MRLLIAGGGTGGHLYPALAVARAFRAEGPGGAVLPVRRKGGPGGRLAAAAVCTTLPGTESRLRGVRVVTTGVPLREGFEPRTPDVPPRRLLVTGGSQGARRLNQAVWSALDGLCQRFEEVVHVAGQQGAD